MSALDVCRAGTWRDMQGCDVRLDEARLDRIVDAHAVADPAPVVVGHPETDAAADDRRRAADAAIAPHVEAGRVLPAERPALTALLAALGDDQGNADEGAAGEHATIAFASASGGDVRMRPAAILERFIEGLPRRVDYRTLAGGPVPGASALAGTHDVAGEDSERIAAEARALMAAEAGKGMTLTPAEAVDRARAKRGLGIGGGE